jgi:hypothetical protein
MVCPDDVLSVAMTESDSGTVELNRASAETLYELVEFDSALDVAPDSTLEAVKELGDELDVDTEWLEVRL